jgi:hypothetical protein
LTLRLGAAVAVSLRLLRGVLGVVPPGHGLVHLVLFQPLSNAILANSLIKGLSASPSTTPSGSALLDEGLGLIRKPVGLAPGRYLLGRRILRQRLGRRELLRFRFQIGHTILKRQLAAEATLLYQITDIPDKSDRRDGRGGIDNIQTLITA